MSKWEDWQVDYLRDNYDKKTNEEIAEFIDKKVTAVLSKRYSLGLKQSEVYLHEVKNTYFKSIARKKMFAEWDKLFAPPQKI